MLARAENLHDVVDRMQLSSSVAWLNHLHVRDGVSEIDDPAFFMHPLGKKQPHAELHALVDALLADKTDNDDSVYCRFPSRSKWLIEHIPALLQQITLPACVSLEKERQTLNATAVSVIFAAAHINSPASAFGHTFLRIDSDLATPLTAYAVNYAAKTAETNGLVYAYRGLFGGYEGRYSISSYAEKVKEYSDLEQRDIWEYQLNLNEAELTRLIDHVFEVRHVYADYYFMKENCSYNLLWLLQVARPDMRLTNQFGWAAIPVDTVRAIEQAGMVEQAQYRPSSRQRMVKLAGNLSHAQSRAFVRSRDYNIDTLVMLPTIEKISALELAVFELKRRRGSNAIDNASYARDLLPLLKVRSRLGEPVMVELERPDPPGAGHLSRRMQVGGEQIQGMPDGRQQLRIGMKLAYHDLYDHEYSYLPGAYISFFDTQFVATQRAVTLDRLSLLDIRSYALQDTFFKPVSWQVIAGSQRLFNDKQHGFLKTGAGVTLGNKNLYGVVMAIPGLYVAGKTFAGGALQLGLFGTQSQLKYGVQFSQEYFTQRRTQQIADVFMTYQITPKWAMNLKLERNKLSHQATINTLGLHTFYYF